jgi:hypothetical protein
VIPEHELHREVEPLAWDPLNVEWTRHAADYAHATRAFDAWWNGMVRARRMILP